MDNVIVGGVGRFIDGAVKQHHCGGVLPGFVLSTAANKDMAGNLPSFRRRTILFREAAPPRIQKCKSMLEHDSLHTSLVYTSLVRWRKLINICADGNSYLLCNGSVGGKFLCAFSGGGNSARCFTRTRLFV